MTWELKVIGHAPSPRDEYTLVDLMQQFMTTLEGVNVAKFSGLYIERDLLLPTDSPAAQTPKPQEPLAPEPTTPSTPEPQEPAPTPDDNGEERTSDTEPSVTRE